MTQSEPAPFLNVLGLMSGTSVDGIDVALIRTDGESVARRGPHRTYGYQADEAQAIRASFGRTTPSRAAVDAVTAAHIRAVEAFLADHAGAAGEIELIGFHGQTTFHDPAAGVTVQIGDGERLATRFGVDVVSDFRAADVAAGGEGAPFAPLFHVAMTESQPKPLAVLNLGGVGNVTWIGTEAPPLAFDTGPANALIDDWMRHTTGQPFDDGGRAALDGRVDANWLAELLDHDYFGRPPPKSLDRETFRPRRWPKLSTPDGAATLVAFTAHAVAAALSHLPEPPCAWYVTGGGRRNPAVMRALADRLGARVEPVEAIGWDGDAVEAQAFAFLAARVLRGLPLSLPTTTGVPKPTPGGRWIRARAA